MDIARLVKVMYYTVATRSSPFAMNSIEFYKATYTESIQRQTGSNLSGHSQF